MRTNHLIVAALFAAVACSENRPASGPTAPRMVPQTARTELTGEVVLPGSDLAPAYLRAGSTLVALLGTEANLIANVEGATVLVRGTMNADPAITVDMFQVLAVHGRAVADGTIERFDDGYGLRLANGSFQLILHMPTALATHVGARVWIADGDGSPFEFGFIRDNQ